MPAHETPAIHTERLTKRFRQVVAVDALNLRVMPGDVFALLGPNGSGKSTTFRLLLNIYRPTSGASFLLGTPSGSLNGRAFDKVGYISEGQKLPKWMRVKQWLDYCRGFYSEWDDELCVRLMDGFGMGRDQKIRHLSRGQCMKVCLASILPARPRLLLLDEPFSGLDVETRASLSLWLKDLAHESGLATLISTHDVEEVEPVANRLGILSRGNLKVDEPLSHYINRHRSLTLTGMRLSDLPQDLRRAFLPVRSKQSAITAFTETYSPELESRVESQLPAGATAHFGPMHLRQILSGHAGSPL